MRSNCCSPIRLALLVSVGLVLGSIAEENWPQFRGPGGMGHSVAGDAPLKWSPESVVWKVSLKGKGQSSPINWGNRIFLTGGSDNGRERYLSCLDSRSGKLLWSRTVGCDSPERPHRMNSYATPTCVTDGTRVVAFSVRLACIATILMERRSGQGR